MKRIVALFGLFFVAAALFFTNPVSAAEITTTHAPDPVESGKEVTVTITSNEEFNPTLSYYYFVTPPSSGPGSLDNRCTNSIGGNISPDSGNKKFTIKFIADQCNTQPGKWQLNLRLGDGNQYFVRNYAITVVPKGGQELSLESAERDVLLGTNPQAILINARQGEVYSFWWHQATTTSQDAFVAPSTGNHTITIRESGTDFKKEGTKVLCVKRGRTTFGLVSGLSCDIATEFRFVPTKNPTGSIQCKIDPSQEASNKDSVSVRANQLDSQKVYVSYLQKKDEDSRVVETKNNPPSEYSFQLGSGLNPGEYTGAIKTVDGEAICQADFVIKDSKDIQPRTRSALSTSCNGLNCTSSGGIRCNPDKPLDEAGRVIGGQGIMTAIGCIPVDPKELVPRAMRVAFGIAGGIAFLLMVFGVFQMITSAGNPEGVKKGWDQLGAAIQGLLVILFAVLLLQIIGFDILGLPGFGRGT